MLALAQSSSLPNLQNHMSAFQPHLLDQRVLANSIQKAAEATKPNGRKPDNGEKAGITVKEAEEAKSDAASKGSDIEKSDNECNWTPEQDTLIFRLKSENVSWKEIAARMSLAKSDIQVRFKELQKRGTQAPATTTMENSRDKNGGKDGKKAEPEQKAAGGGRGNAGRLKADDSWSREDCEILEMLEARYREQKWLSMQASFYNLTGRMVRADIIERKLSEAES